MPRSTATAYKACCDLRWNLRSLSRARVRACAIEEVFRRRAGEPEPDHHWLKVKMGDKFWPRSQPRDQQNIRWGALQARVSEVGGICRYFPNRPWMLHIVKYQDQGS